MNRIRPSHGSRFLIEFLIVLLIFMLTSSIMIQLFVQGSQTSTDAYALNRAVVRAQAITETALSSEGEEEALSRAFVPAADGYELYYDGDFLETDAAGCVYLTRINVYREDLMLHANVIIEKEGTEIYSVRTKRYLGIPGGAYADE
jgi:type II secretory pathway pseudopilin PulG